MLERPAHEGVHMVRGDVGRHMGVWVEPVCRAEPGEGQVAEDVLGDQRRPEQQRDMCAHDRGCQRLARQAARAEQDQQVARAHDQHQRLEPTAAQPPPETVQGTGQPGGPAAARGRHIAGGRPRRLDRQHRDGPEHAEQPHDSQDVRQRRRGVPAAGALADAGVAGAPDRRYVGGCLYRLILAPARQAGVQRARYAVGTGAPPGELGAGRLPCAVTTSGWAR